MHVMENRHKPKNIGIIYFSGTGGTKRAAGALTKSLLEQGSSVHCYEINKRTPYRHQRPDLLLLLYPVYAMNAPGPVYEFIKRLPPARNKAAAVISVSGGGEVIPNTACRFFSIRLLQKKGYRVVYENMLVMPSNFIAATPRELSLQLLAALPSKTQKIAAELLTGVIRRSTPHPIDKIISFLALAEQAGAKIIGHRIKAEQSCNGCGLCAKKCPVGNIRLLQGKPVFRYRCTLCLKCIYDCPKQALHSALIRRYLIKGGYSLRELEKELPDYRPVGIETYPFSAAFMGLKKYLSKD